MKVLPELGKLLGSGIRCFVTSEAELPYGAYCYKVAKSDCAGEARWPIS